MFLNGAVESTDETASYTVDVFWRFEDDAEMYPQFLGTTVPGGEIVVPFDMQGRDIRLFAKSQASDGTANRQPITEAVQTVFRQPTVVTLASVKFASNPPGPRVGLIYAHNGGTGNINIYRRIGDDGDFVLLSSELYTDTGYTDTALPVNGNYYYKLTQDGQQGESVTMVAPVTGVAAPAGSPPSGLAGEWDEVDTVPLTWTNNGGTGDNIIERAIYGVSGFEQVGTVTAATAAYDDTPVVPDYFNRTYIYRISNESVTGYTDEHYVYVPSAEPL